MSVLFETTEGNIVIDVHYKEEPELSFNFLKLCKINHFFFAPFFALHKDIKVSCGVPEYPDVSDGRAITSYGDITINRKDYRKGNSLEIELRPVDNGSCDIGSVGFSSSPGSDSPRKAVDSLFQIALGPDAAQVEDQKCLWFGKVVDGFMVLDKINNAVIEDKKTKRLLRDIRVTHAHVLYDPFEDPSFLPSVTRSSEMPTKSQIANSRFPELVDKSDSSNKSTYNAVALELMGDLPRYDIKPSPTTLFVAKLNPITTPTSLEAVFGRFGTVIACNIVKDQNTRKSLCYGFVEYSDKSEAEKAYGTLQNKCIIDGNNIVVDFSQSIKRYKRENQK
ncbi:Piso0_005508 [Millerozyma farinosa CBS 7064]|uniref:Peptidyl-prolyl cis-trans isomerase n=1 Tax=Pichia sorbitophila (strain ATCC MYA-4447 / BCRC 22081 / CBS 7064 / NBRC 10061 / NRRL Y-12695) TaxID=559304 RepID=G8Y261_PICSO|nr:Piso0_005508 [Millerozyma farinosa CBS 7064]